MHVREIKVSFLVAVGTLLAAHLIAGGDASDDTVGAIGLGSFLLGMITLIVLSERADRRSSDR